MSMKELMALNDNEVLQLYEQSFTVHLQLPGIESRQSLDALLKKLGLKTHYYGACVGWDYRAQDCEGMNHLLIEQTADGAMKVRQGLSCGGIHHVTVTSADSLEARAFVYELVDVILHSWLEFSIICVDWTDIAYLLRGGTTAVLSTKQLRNVSDEEIATVMASALPKNRDKHDLVGAITVLRGRDLFLEAWSAVGSALETILAQDQNALATVLEDESNCTTLSTLWIYS